MPTNNAQLRQDKIERLVRQYEAAIRKWEENADDPSVMSNYLLPEHLWDVLDDVLSSRAPFNMTVKAPTFSSFPLAHAFHKMMGWHTSSGDITGLMMLSFMLSREDFDMMESTVVLFRAALRLPSPAVEAWDRTGLFS